MFIEAKDIFFCVNHVTHIDKPTENLPAVIHLTDGTEIEFEGNKVSLKDLIKLIQNKSKEKIELFNCVKNGVIK